MRPICAPPCRNAWAPIVPSLSPTTGPAAGGTVVSADGTAVLDVLVDLRRGSPTFGQWEGFELSDSNHLQLYCPDGFAHGFCVLSDEADVVYKTSAYYAPELERGFAYDDPEVGIEWPGGFELSPSARDAAAPALAEIAASLPFEYSG